MPAEATSRTATAGLTAAGQTAGRRRADARRNREAILQAGLEVLSTDPDAGLAEIAQASGLTRTTVYAHFANREELLEVLVRRAIDGAAARMDAGAPEKGSPLDALRRVLQQSWREVNRHRGVSTTASRVLGPERLGMLHGPIRARLLALVDRGQRDGSFRQDVPAPWLLATYFALVHLAGEQLAAGALGEDDAETVLLSTVTAAFTGEASPRSAPPQRQDQS